MVDLRSGLAIKRSERLDYCDQRDGGSGMSATDLFWLDEKPTPMERLAAANREALEGLFAQLRRAVHDADLDHAALTESLGMREDEVRSLLSGRWDLTLTDLQALLVAVDAKLQTRLETRWSSANQADPDVADRAQQVQGDRVWDRQKTPTWIALSGNSVRRVHLKRSVWVDA